MKRISRVALITLFLCLAYTFSGCNSELHLNSIQPSATEPIIMVEQVSKQEMVPISPTFPALITNNETTKPSEATKVPENKNEVHFESESAILNFSSPLQGIELEELELINSNPFVYAGPGKDEGHHGTDFSFYQYKTFNQIENLPVLSILDGKVRSVIANRPPYGNMIIIETALTAFPDHFQKKLVENVVFENLPNYTNLNCPNYSSFNYEIDKNSLSLYVLYAHLFDVPGFNIDDQVLSGSQIGKVGNTGSSGNPHLHLEFRIGPSDYNFPEMAHYHNSATDQEMENYCLWRVSGYFSQIDPMEMIQYYLQNR